MITEEYVAFYSQFIARLSYGAIMLLQYGNSDIKFKYRTIKGVGQRDLAPDFLTLDGQQRLTSIYQAKIGRK